MLLLDLLILHHINWRIKYYFKSFKGCLPQILLSPFLNILTHISLLGLSWGHQKHHINKAKLDPNHWSKTPTIRHALFYFVEESRIAESLYFKQISYNNLPLMKCLGLFHRFLQLSFWEPKSRLLILVI